MRRPVLLAAIAAPVLLGAATGGGIALAQPVTYAATSVVYVSSQGARAVQDLTKQASFDRQGAESYAKVATTPIVLRQVISTLHLPLTTAELAREVTAEVPADTVTIRLTARDGSPARAARIANAVAAAVARSAALLTPSNDAAVHITPIETARAATAAEDHGLWFAVPLGALAGVGAVLLVVAVTAMRRMPPPSGGSAPSLRTA